MEPEITCVSCGCACSLDEETRTASCTGVKDDGEPCPQRYGFYDEDCRDGWLGPYATIFGAINDERTLDELVAYKRSLDCLWAALRTRLGRLTVAQYDEAVAESKAEWERAASDYRLEKGWAAPRNEQGIVRRLLARLIP